ncbi:hypothetical protein L7F22_031615 [Adiantum nelumboides]|nr:hypothetical protein [Adiantum nelumboides]
MLGFGPSAGTQGSATQDPHIAASDSSSDFDFMEGYPIKQHPESSSQDMHALGQQVGSSMFSRLKETLSRATHFEHATNEINEGGGEVDSPFTSQIDPVLSESAHVSTPATTSIGPLKLTPSETLLTNGRSLAEVQKALMTSTLPTNPLQSPELTTLKSQTIGSHFAFAIKDTPNTSILDGVFLNENWEYNLQRETLTDIYTSYTYHVGWLDVIQATSNSISVDEQQRLICDVIHSIVQMERQKLGINMPSMGLMRFLDTAKAKQPTISQMETPAVSPMDPSYIILPKVLMQLEPTQGIFSFPDLAQPSLGDLPTPTMNMTGGAPSTSVASTTPLHTSVEPMPILVSVHQPYVPVATHPYVAPMPSPNPIGYAPQSPYQSPYFSGAVPASINTSYPTSALPKATPMSFRPSLGATPYEVWDPRRVYMPRPKPADFFPYVIPRIPSPVVPRPIAPIHLGDLVAFAQTIGRSIVQYMHNLPDRELRSKAVQVAKIAQKFNGDGDFKKHVEIFEQVLLLFLFVQFSWASHLGDFRSHLKVDGHIMWMCGISIMHDHSDELIKSLEMLCKDGHLHKALELIDSQAPPVTPDVYRYVLQACINRKDLEIGHKQKKHFLTCPNVFAWSAVISACIKHGQAEQALEFYQRMQKSYVQPDAHTFVAGLKACAVQGALIFGMLVHAQILEKGLDSVLYVGNALIHMYCKCGNLQEACKVFNNQMERDIVTWNAMLAGYALNLKAHEAFEPFICMYQAGNVDTITFVNLLKLCSDTESIVDGNLTLFVIVEKSLEQEEFVVSTGIDVYAKCGCLNDAYYLFEKLASHDVVTWNALIVGISQNDEVKHGYKTLEVYQKMLFHNCLLPDSTTYACVLRACSNIGALVQAKFIITCIIERLMQELQQVGEPPDAGTWNSLLAGYSQHGYGWKALAIFKQMQQEGVLPDRCGSLRMAHKVFDLTCKQQVVIWNTLIAGYAQHGNHKNVNGALRLFGEMVSGDLQPDSVTLVSMVKGCSLTGAFNLGELFYAYAAASSSESNTALCNACIEMYALCGSLGEALLVFQRQQKRDRISWNTLIAAFALQGNAKLSIKYLENMQREGVKPDIVTFTSLLSACGHLGLSNEANLLIESINQNYTVSPTVEQINCVVDILRRSGRLVEAEGMLTSLLPHTNLIGWTALLSSCRMYGNVEIGSRCFSRMLGRIDYSLHSVFTLM